MAEEQAQATCGADEDELTPGYKPPAQKSLKEIAEQDQEDESLRKYKEMLLGNAAKGDETTAFPNDPRRVIVTKLCFCPEGRDEMELDLTGDLAAVKETKFVVKEGCKYKLKVHFYVQYEIVSGLRYKQQTYTKGIQVDKENYMVGSYSPKSTEHVFTSPVDEMPSGMLSRGHYKIKSLFTDDDKNKHLEWEWKIDIKKDWA